VNPRLEPLVERLTSMIESVPDAVDVVALAAPDAGTAQRRLGELFADVGALAGVDVQGAKVHNAVARTVLRTPGGARAAVFHASGAMTVNLGLAPFEGIFDDDPGDEQLVGLVEASAERLGIGKRLPDDDALAFERLWRIKAAGGDADGQLRDPVLCRAVGAYRHVVRELPVYGRASATIHLAAKGTLDAVSLSSRRFADDGGGRTIERARTVAPGDAARVVTEQLSTLFRTDDAEGVEVTPDWFRFGYLSLGRRRPQAVLAPCYVAGVSLQHEEEATAHVIVAPGSRDQYLKIPRGQASSGLPRSA
jgi:hypothetical protein